MVDGDLDLAKAITQTRIAKPQDDSTSIITHITESLDSTGTSSMASQGPLDFPPPLQEFNNDDIPTYSPPQTPRPKKARVCIHIIRIMTNT